ncbi:uncharacterized protein F5Z01DRAFT_62013 [Emericellopsis atlantica]|uniref:AMP-activated protein kinase glycogen-binding domain-containing protein n=1 Tax=Emericellopsis atlantica TaxID=2614577 RepID=A0A9P7ZMP0_9HYPO|nr:uncharacterized protein F5Z01DRAFT_62013 [Emericellopsis atlantica]KAG9254948.1 hypothetical protein F5Z01DRAFT_62013 [Emericellopsis atlantica]
MSRSVVTQTITYRKPDTLPPVFVAGSFSEPAWTPLHMEYALDMDGEYVFTREVRLVPGREYQFKFRLGNMDIWAISHRYPTSESSFDDEGNQNNLLKVEPEYTQPAQKSMPGKVLNDKGIVNIEDSPLTKPVDTSARNADDEYSYQDCDPVQSPLFAHESFGAYEFANDGLEQDESVAMIPRLSKTASKDFAANEADPNDPMVESFPSERGPVMDALRKIQSSSNDDSLHAIKASMSPFMAPRRESVDSATDDVVSTESLSPTNNSMLRKQNMMPAHSGLFTTKSTASLGSIAEEDSKEPRSVTRTLEKGGKGASQPRKTVFEGLDSGPSDEDEGVVLKNAKARTDESNHQVKKWFGVTG